MGTQQAPLAVRKGQTRCGRFNHVLMAAIEEALEPGDETKLSSLITPLRQSYDFILIDTPPGKAMLAFNGLAAADLIIIPASAERMAVDGVADLINHVQRIMWNKFNLTHQELRILFTMYRSTTTHSPAIVENARKIWRDNILNVKIPTRRSLRARMMRRCLPINLSRIIQAPSPMMCSQIG